MARKDFPELSAAEYKALKRALSEVGHSEAALIRKRKARAYELRVLGEDHPALKPRAKKKRAVYANPKNWRVGLRRDTSKEIEWFARGYATEQSARTAARKAADRFMCPAVYEQM